MAVRIVLIEDDVNWRDLLEKEIKGCPGIKCIGAFSTYDAAALQLPALRPDVIVLDLSLPGTSGAVAAREIKLQSRSRVLVLTAAADKKTILELFEAGADGYALKLESIDRLAVAIWRVYLGHKWLSEIVLDIYISATNEEARRAPATTFPFLDKLSPLEKIIVEKRRQGQQYKEICEAHDISDNTLKTHVKRILKKSFADTTTEAIFNRELAVF